MNQVNEWKKLQEQIDEQDKLEKAAQADIRNRRVQLGLWHNEETTVKAMDDFFYVMLHARLRDGWRLWHQLEIGRPLGTLRDMWKFGPRMLQEGSFASQKGRDSLGGMPSVRQAIQDAIRKDKSE